MSATLGSSLRRVSPALCLALACATGGAPAPHEAAPTATVVTEEASRAPTPPPEVSDALLPPLQLPAARDLAERQPRFDLAVSEAPARDFFLNLVDGTEYALVVHPEVEGKISLTLRGATIPEILEAVREVYGYDVRPSARGFYVLPARLQLRIFPVDYPHVQRQGRSQTRVSAGQLSDQVGSGRSSSGSSVLGVSERQRSLLESSQVQTDSSADFWGEIASSLRLIVGAKEGRSVVVSPHAGIVVVRAMPSELREAAQFLRRAQVRVERQVILEAKILEVDLNDGFRAGINWALLIETGAKSILAAQTGGATLLGDAAVSNTDTPAFGGIFSLALDLNDFQAFVELLETQGEVRVLSSPQISTVNNQKAMIKVGQDEFFVTDVSSTTVTATTTTTTPQIELTPFFSGIALDVLPQISDRGDVILHIHPSVSQVQDQTKTFEVAGETQSLPLALSTIRESDSIVRARSGQVIVIGGLMQETSNDRVALNPVIGRIPYLGALFRQTRQDSRKSELVILLRPTVVDDTGWGPELSRVRDRLSAPPYLLGDEYFFGVDPESPPR